MIALPLHLAYDGHRLYLGVSRPGHGRQPWYLITTADQAWRIILANARRWPIEMSLRCSKTELALAFESPRLIAGEVSGSSACSLPPGLTRSYSRGLPTRTAPDAAG
jgi:hypothetical protein